MNEIEKAVLNIEIIKLETKINCLRDLVKTRVSADALYDELAITLRMLDVLQDVAYHMKTP